MNPTSLPFTTGGSGQPADATPAEVITAMQNTPGWFSQQIYQSIVQEDPFLKFISGTKRFFNEQMGDTDTTLIFDIGMPTERDALGWQEIREASPGYNPSAFAVTKEISYGHRKVSSTLFRDAVRTPSFSKIDLAFKPRREAQIAQILQIMTNWTRGIWPHWARNAWQKASRCRVLNSHYGHASEQDNSYPTFVSPNEELTFEHLESMFVHLNAAPRGFKTAGQAEGIKQVESKLDGKQVIFIGHEELKVMIDHYFRGAVTNHGYRPTDAYVPELGHCTPLGKYFFVPLSTPRRYRERVGNETWDDCIIPSTIQVPAQGGAKAGVETIPNPDYFNPAIAKYSEIFMPNLDTAEWLVPPAAMTKAITEGGKQWFPASDYAGEFMPINFPTQSDPMAETCYFIARYMAGMKSLFPARSRAILALACHAKVDGEVVLGGMNNGVHFPIVAATVTVTGSLQFLISGTLPGSGPAGTALYAVTTNGLKYLVGNIAANTAFAGDTKNPAGRVLELTLAAGLVAAQTARTGGDPWEYLSFLPTATPSDPATGLPTNLPEDLVPTIGAIFATDTVTGAENAALASLFSGTYTTAAALKTALDTYLGANGGGTSVVTMATTGPNAYIWTVKITGMAGAGLTALRTGNILFQDGAGINKVPFVGTNLP